MIQGEKRGVFEILNADLTPRQFQKISELVHRMCGIKLRAGKEALVRSRLMKRLRALGLAGFKEYFLYLQNDKTGRELGNMIDVITTNKTSFFRERDHFEYLRREVIPTLKKKRVRLWSAGCSSGEEPYSLAILLREELSDIDRRDIRILATDISLRMLERVHAAVYGAEVLNAVAPALVGKYFDCFRNGNGYHYRVKDSVRQLVKHARLNLIEPWPMKGPFNAIFCRNVMIYFDRATQERLISRFYDLLEPGGNLFVGHSESLSSITHAFGYVKPAVYRKPR